jgi:hypothetical protein
MTRMYWDKHGIEGISIRIGSASERPTEFRHLSTRLGHDDLVQLLMCCIEGPEVGYLAVWGVSNNTRSYYDTSAVERIGWSGAGQHRPETSKPSAQRPGEQERGKRLSREERERASFLRRCLGRRGGCPEISGSDWGAIARARPEERPDGRACEQDRVELCGRGLSRASTGSARGCWLVSHTEGQGSD